MGKSELSYTAGGIENSCTSLYKAIWQYLLTFQKLTPLNPTILFLENYSTDTFTQVQNYVRNERTS